MPPPPPPPRKILTSKIVPHAAEAEERRVPASASRSGGIPLPWLAIAPNGVKAMDDADGSGILERCLFENLIATQVYFR